MNKKRTIEDIKKISFNLYKDEYEIVSNDYINTSTKIKIKHNICGYISELIPNSFLNKRSKCLFCFGNRQNIDIIKKRCYDIYKNEYTILSDSYINNHTKIKIKHNICGNIYESTSGSFLNAKKGCMICNGNPKLTIEEIRKKCFEIHHGEYEIISDIYVNIDSKIEVKHNICGNIYSILPNSFINKKTKCSFCYGKRKQTILDIKRRCFELHGHNYQILGTEFKNIDDKISIKHKCGYVWNVKITNFLNKKSGCPECSPKSLGELRIIEFLKNNKLNFYKEKEFEKCKYLSYLHFDFYLPEFNICIEYDGEQHFNSVERFGGIDSYKSQLEKDKIKNEFCEKNNIKLIRIPYWEIKNIESILEKELAL